MRSITLFIFGGIAQIGTEPPSAAAEFFVAIAGPIVSFTLAAFFTVVKPVVVGIEPLWGLAKYLAYINMALVLFNLVPRLPARWWPRVPRHRLGGHRQHAPRYPYRSERGGASLVLSSSSSASCAYSGVILAAYGLRSLAGFWTTLPLPKCIR